MSENVKQGQWSRPDSWTNEMHWIDAEARRMALAINGGSWANSYTEGQKMGWRLIVQYMVERVKEW